MAALQQLEALALASTLCKWTPAARRKRCLALLRALGFAGAAPTPEPRPQEQPQEQPLPEALQLSDKERGATLAALDGPLCAARSPGLSKPILLRLNEARLRSDLALSPTTHAFISNQARCRRRCSLS